MKKSKIAYNRKLYIAHLIATGEHNLVSLIETTGMAKGTLQTAMNGLNDIGIEYHFKQTGARSTDGHYEIMNWGDHSPKWIKENLHTVIDSMQGGT